MQAESPHRVRVKGKRVRGHSGYHGSRPILARVEMTRNCTSNDKDPKVRSFYVTPGTPVRLAKAWRETSCRHSYRVIGAKYQ